MIIDNSCYNILRTRPLNITDEVIFIYDNEKYHYRVEKNHLSSSSLTDNDVIFTVLGLDPNDTATKQYEYNHRGGRWPEAISYDFEALTRLVLFLFEEIERREWAKACIKTVSESKIKSSRVKIKIQLESQIKINIKK